MLQNGFVECRPKEQCPSQEGCHMLLEQPKDGCCRKCKGCYHRGILRDSGTTWRDPREPCILFTCKAGVVTETEERCYVPCTNPLPPAPGQCCPTCNGNHLNLSYLLRFIYLIKYIIYSSRTCPSFAGLFHYSFESRIEIMESETKNDYFSLKLYCDFFFFSKLPIFFTTTHFRTNNSK